MGFVQVIFLGFMIFMMSRAYALEVDEKLTTRLLSVSASKKTILINRGIEDGLVVGDHAKLFLTTGVVGRAVVIKVSPTRSIWSVYRLVNPQFIVSDRVLSLKIASPLQLTEDSSKALVVEPRYSGRESIKIVNDKSSDREETRIVDSSSDQQDFMDLKEDQQQVNPTHYRGNIQSKSWEVFGMLNLAAYSGSREDDDNSVDISSSGVDFTVGVEKYFWNSSGFLRNMSFFGLVNSRSSTVTVSKTTSSESTNQFGGGVNYYFYNRPYHYGKILGLFRASAGLGSAKRTLETNETEETTDDPSDLSGKSSFFTLGVGGKFFMRNQFGLVGMLDYSRLSTTFEFDEGGSETTALSGIRIRFGLAYRF